MYILQIFLLIVQFGVFKIHVQRIKQEKIFQYLSNMCIGNSVNTAQVEYLLHL